MFVNNLKFELLFELGINALIDGYPREAVSSFASALERFYEFFCQVAASALSIPEMEFSKAWRTVAKQSERQLGMFVLAHLFLLKLAPPLLSNNEVKFRNDIIHGGYVPSHQEAVSFGDRVLILINQALDSLRGSTPKELEQTCKTLLQRPKEADDEIVGSVNILTTIEVMNPPQQDDPRRAGVEAQFQRILRDRVPRQMQLLSEAEMKKKFPDRELHRRS